MAKKCPWCCGFFVARHDVPVRTAPRMSHVHRCNRVIDQVEGSSKSKSDSSPRVRIKGRDNEPSPAVYGGGTNNDHIENRFNGSIESMQFALAEEIKISKDELANITARS